MSHDFHEDEPIVHESHGVSLAKSIRRIDKRIRANQAIIETIPTGLALLDQTTGGLVRGEYLGIVAAPGVGKSTIADSIVVSALQQNDQAKAIIFNLETSTPVRTARIIAGQCVKLESNGTICKCVEVTSLLRGTLEVSEKSWIRKRATQLESQIGPRLHFIDDYYDGTTIAEIISIEKPDIVLIDHLGLVGMNAGLAGSMVDHFDSALNLISTELKGANAAGILINEVSKLGLNTGASDLAAVRGSARFASLAGAFVGINRVAQAADHMQKLNVQLHKNRHGRGGVQQSVTLYGELSYLVWEDSIEQIPIVCNVRPA